MNVHLCNRHFTLTYAQFVLSYCPAVKPVDPLVIILGVLLGICVGVITAQAILSFKKERYYNSKGELFE